MRFLLALFAILVGFLMLRSLLAPLVNAVVALLSPAPESPAQQAQASAQPAAELKRDPVCGAFISPELAVTDKHKGQTVHFCSKKCRDEYFRKA
jgi:YHS domain-containing protein